MPIIIPSFNTTGVINGNTLVSQADEQLNIMMSDMTSYLQNSVNTIVNEVEASAADVFTKTEVQNTLPAVGLDTTLNTTPNVGQFTWNTDDFTANLGMQFGVTQQVGQEFFIPVQNTSGSTILNGRPVMAVGTTGNSGKVLINYHNGLQANAKFVIGLTTGDIANNQSGLITVCGKVRNIDTTGTPYGETWLDGDVIYIKPNSTGLLTKVQPSDTQLKMPIAFVIHAHSAGTLMVRTTPVDENAYISYVGTIAIFEGALI